MRTIAKIISVEKRTKNGAIYFVTTALLDNQDEVEGYSLDPEAYTVGEKVMAGMHDRYNRAKMWKK